MLVIANDSQSIIDVIKAMQNMPYELPAVKELTTVEDNPKDIPEASKPKRFCYDCGEFFNDDDMVVEYQFDDYTDTYKALYHKECEPNKDEMVGYREIKRLGETKIRDIGKPIIDNTQSKVTAHNLGKEKTKQKRQALLDIIRDKQPIRISALFKAQNIYKGGGFYTIIKKFADDGLVEKQGDVITIKGA